MTTTATQAPQTQGAWYAMTRDETCRKLDVDPAVGLSAAEVEARRAQYGANKLADEAKEPAWKAFVRQYEDLMQLVLLGTAVVAVIGIQDWSTACVLVALTVFNALMGLHQEGKAAESVEALKQMLIMTANVKRDGLVQEVPAEELVPGDIVGFEAGDKVPADGRVLVVATLEIEEAGLTGESTPVPKSVEPVIGDDIPLGDRVDMAYMNSQVTRGRGEMVVTATGMSTEVGHISGMLSSVEDEKTPLTKQLDQLTIVITLMAAAALVLIVILGVIRGEEFDTLFLTGISLAIASIPSGLPAVVTMLLSMGTRDLAGKGAIIKRLKSVETLGSTSAICSDKTGTLTLNQMTARELVVVGGRFHVDGQGYSTEGRILRAGGSGDAAFEPHIMPMALANDAVIRDGQCIGDPTEGALVVLAAKGGIDVEETRRLFPRVAEVPFDAAYKLMGTFHQIEEGGRTVIRCFVKGAPDVLLKRSSTFLDPDGSQGSLDGQRERVLAENDRLASEGLRVLAIARKDFDPATFDRNAVLLDLLEDLQLLALIGIVDPPRKEAKDAIALCRTAGIRVRMITGDHATTAAAIAGQLGIEGRAITGAEFAAMSDEELFAQVDEIGVVARVAPEDKVRLVTILKQQGNVVAMTGDGVNDAPALKTADIGVAMGITGTEVTKDAAEMILTDDNFATIVTAVEGGRGLYDNLMKYVRIQMIIIVGFILAFVGAGIFDVVDGIPITPLQILWINFAIDVVLAVGLGFDVPTAGLMARKPRPIGERVIVPRMAVRLGVAGTLVAIGTLVAAAWGENEYDIAVATTMAFMTASMLHIVAAFEWRDPMRTVFTRDSIANGRFNLLMLTAFAMAFLATTIPALRNLLDTVQLNGDQWRVCLIVTLSYFVLAEIGKVIVNLVERNRSQGQRSPSTATAAT